MMIYTYVVLKSIVSGRCMESSVFEQKRVRKVPFSFTADVICKEC